ncbi:MAG TPA: hypothetical protein DCZ93_02090 [Elusimicrobia bacterium]|nr:hypothetical protein [Elusimicrobiota bacterium]
MNEEYRLIAFFALGCLVQAVLLVRNHWSWGRFLVCFMVCPFALWQESESGRDYNLPVRLFVSLCLFTGVFAAAFRDALFPRVNEKVLLAYTLTFWYAFFSFVFSPTPLWYCVMSAMALPTLGILFLAVSDRKPSFAFKLFFYIWYLLMVVFMGLLQFSYSYMLSFFTGAAARGETPASAALAGMAFCYIAIHFTYLIGILPINGGRGNDDPFMGRDWHERVNRMTGRFNDNSQLSVLQTFSLVLVFGGFLAGNYFYKFISAATAVNLGILLPLLLMPDAEREEHPAVVAAGKVL